MSLNILSRRPPSNRPYRRALLAPILLHKIKKNRFLFKKALCASAYFSSWMVVGFLRFLSTWSRPTSKRCQTAWSQKSIVFPVLLPVGKQTLSLVVCPCSILRNLDTTRSIILTCDPTDVCFFTYFELTIFNRQRNLRSVTWVGSFRKQSEPICLSIIDKFVQAKISRIQLTGVRWVSRSCSKAEPREWFMIGCCTNRVGHFNGKNLESVIGFMSLPLLANGENKLQMVEGETNPNDRSL